MCCRQMAPSKRREGGPETKKIRAVCPKFKRAAQVPVARHGPTLPPPPLSCLSGQFISLPRDISVSSHDGVGGERGWTWAGVNLGHCCRFGLVVGWAWWHHASKTGSTEGNIRGVLKPNKTTYHLDNRQSRLPHVIKVSISGGPDGTRQKMTRSRLAQNTLMHLFILLLLLQTKIRGIHDQQHGKFFPRATHT